MKHRVLILTDHRNHSAENSLYTLAAKMLLHPMTASIDIASKGNKVNSNFFSCEPNSSLSATSINQSFAFQTNPHPLSINHQAIALNSYDLIWLRMPPPLSADFLTYLGQVFEGAVIINNPNSIHQTGSKSFLTNFPSISPPMKICKSLDDINEFRQLFPIVLKPFRSYGGHGIVKIEQDTVFSDADSYPFETFAKKYSEHPSEYLAVKYLKNVKQGDKRIIVVNGEILGASLRLPAEDSWLCNVSMGGSSTEAEITSEEEKIISHIDPILSKLGIVMYGVDTLVDDEGKRILSEINTTSIGGLPQIAAMRKEPLVEKAIDLIWDYYKTASNG